MSGLTLPRGRLHGRWRAPGSKSLTNRALVCAAAAPGESRLLEPLVSDDTRVLAESLERLGARVRFGERAVEVHGPLAPEPDREVELDIGPAGTPARFLCALAAALPCRALLDGSPRMRERPMGPLVDALTALGASIEPLGRPGFLPLRIRGGTLRGGWVTIRGDVSSQFLSALMLASPLVPGGIELDVAGPLASASYLELTRRVIAAFGGGPGGYRAARYRVPGDDSAACFFLAGALVSRGRLEVDGLERDSAQPDAVFRAWAEEAGAALEWSSETLVVDATRTTAVRALAADVDQAPDAALPLAALLAFAGGESTLTGVARLRDKESDRLAAAVDLVTRAGARAEEDGRRLTISPGPPRRADFQAHGDHRVAMSAAVLALGLPAGCTLDEPAVAAKSNPRFFEDWAALLS